MYIYINEICNLPFEPSTKLILYVDDILMYIPFSSQTDFNHLQNDINIVDKWNENQFLRFNTKNARQQFFQENRNIVLPTNLLLLKGQDLQFVDSIKFLGLTINFIRLVVRPDISSKFLVNPGSWSVCNLDNFIILQICKR